MFGRQRAATIVAEFLGTGILTLVFLSIQRSNIGIPFFIALGSGAVVAVAAFFFGDSSGAHLNPAVTIGLWTARKISSLVALSYVIVQLLGAWAAYGIFRYFAGQSLQPIGGHFSAKVLLSEAIGAFVLALAWGAVYFKKHDTTNRALLLGGSYALAIIIAAAAGVGIGIANPAVAFGIRAWGINGVMGWGTYALGPVLGAIIGVNLYALLFAPSSDQVIVSETVIVAESASPSSRSTAKKTTAKKTTTKKSTAKKSTSSNRRRR